MTYRQKPYFLQAPKLGDVAVGRANNLNLIRLVSASAVILSHCWDFAGVLDPVQRYVRFFSLGDLAVRCFFFLSGYLILQSGLRTEDTSQYLAGRVFRIFPGLAVAVLIFVFVLGPVVTTLPVGDYFSNPGTWTFLREMTLYRTLDTLPGVFTQGHFSQVVDGVLWTLPVEWTMYLVVLLGCLIYRGRAYLGGEPKVKTIELVLALGLTLQMMPIQHDQHAKSWVSYFVLGSLCYLIRKWIPLVIPVAILLMSADIALIGMKGTFGNIGNGMVPLALCYSLLTIGFHPALVFKGFLRVGDYSYGLYIFALPVQQVLLTYIHDSPWLLFIATYIPTLIIAILSWHFVERPSLGLRDKLIRWRKY